MNEDTISGKLKPVYPISIELSNLNSKCQNLTVYNQEKSRNKQKWIKTTVLPN